VTSARAIVNNWSGGRESREFRALAAGILFLGFNRSIAPLDALEEPAV
jgi:hypothetical protein